MNNVYILLIVLLFFNCKKQVQTDNRQQTIVTEKAVIDSKKPIEDSNQETLVEFLDRAKKICQSSNENDLKKIITFPVFGHGTDEEGNNFKDSFPNVESLKNNPLIFNLLFKEHLALATKIVDNKTMGKDWYYVMSEGGLEGVNYSFKLKVIEDKFYITGFEIPGV